MEFVPQVMNRSSNNKNKRKKMKSVNSLLKVVYISSPMKVKTSASRFRTLVQELTGRHSDISRFVDDSNSTASRDQPYLQDFEILPEIKRVSNTNNNHHHQLQEQQPSSSPSSISFIDSLHQDDSPTSSESYLMEQEQPPTFDDAFINEHYFQGLLSADLFTDSSELDVLGSYHSL